MLNAVNAMNTMMAMPTNRKTFRIEPEPRGACVTGGEAPVGAEGSAGANELTYDIDVVA
jgi:hypothetical protein